ncbi:MAG: 2-hydroxyacyl-CoA dehydratase [Acidobacteria bacterium]|nr:2-hydroxyacyl-CoA dehydratase [Acidobacteriota bacterium]
MNSTEIIEKFRTAARDPFHCVRSLKKEKHCPVVGYTCTYFPEEIVLAAEAHPLRLFGESGMVLKADAHIQAYGCSLARSVFEDALSGQLDFLDVMAFPHSCDTMQRLSDIWRLNIKNTVHLDLLFPVHLKSEAAGDYLKAVLERFKKELEQALQTEISGSALSGAISLTNRIRSALHSLYRIRAAAPERISGSDLNRVVRGCMILDRSTAADLLETLADELGSVNFPAGKQPVKRLLLSGGACLHPDIHDIIEQQGGAVVWDDLCTGNRYFDTPVPDGPSPVSAIAERFLDRAVCPAKHSGIDRRGKELSELVSKYEINGVIFLLLKFCDPHGFDYPDLKATLEEAGVPSLFLEVESGKPVDGPTRTRVETFLQILNQQEPMT